MRKCVQEIANELSHSTFLGGPVGDFEALGRLQLISLLRCGLYPYSKVLDIGCGCLRGGYWLIHFLNPDCYYGIEPNADMLNAGINAFLDREILEAKRPRFAHNPNFDPSGFGSSFDFFIARSIWTHSSKNQIEAMLDSFVKHGAEDSVFLASYLPSADDGYTGEGWVGRSHESNVGGMVGHGFAWIQQKCAIRGLRVAELPVDRIRQIWLMVCKGNGCAPITHWLRELFA